MYTTNKYSHTIHIHDYSFIIMHELRFQIRYFTEFNVQFIHSCSQSKTIENVVVSQLVVKMISNIAEFKSNKKMKQDLLVWGKCFDVSVLGGNAFFPSICLNNWVYFKIFKLIGMDKMWITVKDKSDRKREQKWVDMFRLIYTVFFTNCDKHENDQCEQWQHK